MYYKFTSSVNDYLQDQFGHRDPHAEGIPEQLQHTVDYIRRQCRVVVGMGENLIEFINKFCDKSPYIPTGTSLGVIYERNARNDEKTNVPFSSSPSCGV